MLEQQELWQAVKVSQQALSKVSQFSRLFEHVFHDALPHVTGTKGKNDLFRSQSNTHKHFENIWIADGSTLEALFRKLESLQDAPGKWLASSLSSTY